MALSILISYSALEHAVRKLQIKGRVGYEWDTPGSGDADDAKMLKKKT